MAKRATSSGGAPEGFTPADGDGFEDMAEELGGAEPVGSAGSDALPDPAPAAAAPAPAQAASGGRGKKKQTDKVKCLCRLTRSDGVLCLPGSIVSMSVEDIKHFRALGAVEPVYED